MRSFVLVSVCYRIIRKYWLSLPLFDVFLIDISSLFFSSRVHLRIQRSPLLPHILPRFRRGRMAFLGRRCQLEEIYCTGSVLFSFRSEHFFHFVTRHTQFKQVKNVNKLVFHQVSFVAFVPKDSDKKIKTKIWPDLKPPWNLFPSLPGCPSPAAAWAWCWAARRQTGWGSGWGSGPGSGCWAPPWWEWTQAEEDSDSSRDVFVKACVMIIYEHVSGTWNENIPSFSVV